MKRKTVKKKTKIQTPTQPSKPPQFQFSQSYSHCAEISSKLIINKLISKAITFSFSKSIENRIGIGCSDYFKTTINPMLQIEYIYHDNDNVFKDEDNWLDIDEPIKPINDRDVYSLMKFKRFTSIKNSILEQNEKKNRKGAVSTNSSPINLKPLKHHFSRTNISNFSLKSSKDVFPRSKERNSSSLLGLTDYPPPKKKDRVLIINIPSFDITNIDSNRFKDIKNAAELRIEKEKEIIERMKGKDEEKRRVFEKERKKNTDKEVKKGKEFDINKYTFDSNGNVIFYKYLPKDKLNTDFTIVKFDQKEIGHIKEKNFKSNETNNFNSDNAKSKNNNTKEEPKIEVNLSQEQKMKLLFNRNAANVNEVKYIKVFSGKYDNISNSQTHQPFCIPAGNNFGLISPEIGVIIKNEANEQKLGSMDFYRKYNRISMHEFQRKANENVIPVINTLTEVKNNIKDSNQTMNGNKLHTRNNNCHTTISNTDFTNHDNTNKSKRNLPFGMNHSSSCTQIKMNTKISNLKMALESLDNEYDHKHMLNNNTFSNIVFKKNKLNSFVTTVNSSNIINEDIKYNEIDKFTSNIINRKQGEWGEIQFAKPPPQVNPYKNKIPMKSSGSMKDLKHNKIILKPIQSSRLNIHKRRAHVF